MTKLQKAVAVLTFMWAGSALAQSNLCFNGDFSSTNDPLEGWNVNYEWLENRHYANNHKQVNVLPSYKGKKNVCWMTTTHQTKIESKIIPIEKGARYKCTIDEIGGGLICYMNCYKWEPGIAPHPNPTLPELRRGYKSDVLRGVGGKDWKTFTFYVPMDEMSELAYKHWQDMRFMTVYILNDHNNAGIGVTNVKLVKIPGATYKVIKSDLKDKTAVKAQFKRPDRTEED
jgi:hypothetical protein